MGEATPLYLFIRVSLFTQYGWAILSAFLGTSSDAELPYSNAELEVTQDARDCVIYVSKDWQTIVKILVPLHIAKDAEMLVSSFAAGLVPS